MTKLVDQISSSQYNNICQHWKTIEELIYELNHIHYSKKKTESVEYNQKIETKVKILMEKLDYHQKEYEKYINDIGLQLNNQNYDDMLFNLLNNGITERQIC